jgi:hypothetical protein
MPNCGVDLQKAISGYEKPYLLNDMRKAASRARKLGVVVLICRTAGRPDDAGEKNHGEAANHEKNHGRSPCGKVGGTVPASGYLMKGESAQGAIHMGRSTR